MTDIFSLKRGLAMVFDELLQSGQEKYTDIIFFLMLAIVDDVLDVGSRLYIDPGFSDLKESKISHIDEYLNARGSRHYMNLDYIDEAYKDLMNVHEESFFYLTIEHFPQLFINFMLVLERYQMQNSGIGGELLPLEKNRVRSFDFFRKMVVNAKPYTKSVYDKNGQVVKFSDTPPSNPSRTIAFEIGRDTYLRKKEAADIKRNASDRMAEIFKERGFPYSDSYNDYIRFLKNNFEYMTLDGIKITLNHILSLLFPYPIKYETLSKGHTYIVGRSGSGKSELLKSICVRLLDAYVLIDPHGDLSDEVSDNFKHVTRIAPHERRFVINPFDIADKSEENRELVAQEITDLVTSLVEDSGLSRLMTTIIFPIVYTLLKLPYADFKMLADCINPNTGKEFIASLRPYVESHHKAIWKELEGDTYDTSKQSVFNRLQSLLNYRLITQTICGRDDFSTEIEPDFRYGIKVVISLPIPVIGEAVAVTLGRFIMTRMQIWAKRRRAIPPKDRDPVHLVVDEFHNFLTKTTAETLDQFGRKFGLFLVLAHQHIQQITDREIKSSILANTTNKIAGMSNVETRQAVSREMDIDSEALNNIKTGHFWAKLGNNSPICFYNKISKGFSPKGRKYAKSKNDAVVLDGWDICRIDRQQQRGKEQTVSQFKPKFDI